MHGSVSARLVAAILVAVVANPRVGVAAPSPSPAPALSHSTDPQSAPPDSVVVRPTQSSVPASPPPVAPEVMERAQFSAGRMFVEILAGGLAGSLAGYITFEALCSHDSDCIGPALAATLVDFAVTPLVVHGVGGRLGGQGTLSMSYAGASAAFAGFSGSGSTDETPEETIARINLEFAVALVLMPVTTAVTYELVSHMQYKRWREAAQAGNLSFGVAPLHGSHRSLDGAMGQLALRF
jgi:hypothetical protein